MVIGTTQSAQKNKFEMTMLFIYKHLVRNNASSHCEWNKTFFNGLVPSNKAT